MPAMMKMESESHPTNVARPHKYVSADRRAISVGTVPVIWSLLYARSVSANRRPNSVGAVPVK
jgi:hypothetical protein